MLSKTDESKADVFESLCIGSSTGDLNVFAKPTKPEKSREKGLNLQSSTPHALQPRQPYGSLAQLRQFGSLIVWLSQAQAPGSWLVVGLFVGLGGLVGGLVGGRGGTQSSTPYNQHLLIISSQQGELIQERYV